MFTFFQNDVAGISADLLNWITLGVIVFLTLLVLYVLYRIIRRPRLASGRRSKQARLAVTDAALIDERRKLVLVRRDDVEHLVLIGGASDLVIESDIRRNAPARPLTTPAPAPVPTPAPAPKFPEPAAAPSPAVPVAPVKIPPPAPAAASVPIPAPAPKPASAPEPVASPVAIPSVAAVGGGLAAAAVGTAALASSSAEAAKDKVASLVPEVKSEQAPSAVDDMDALLDEITTDK